MSYRKIYKTPFIANDPRPMVLRQKYAQLMIPLLAGGQRVLNIDQTWLPHLDFRSHSWALKSTKNTVRVKDLSARVNMIAALDTDGQVYAALT